MDKPLDTELAHPASLLSGPHCIHYLSPRYSMLRFLDEMLSGFLLIDMCAMHSELYNGLNLILQI